MPQVGASLYWTRNPTAGTITQYLKPLRLRSSPQTHKCTLSTSHSALHVAYIFLILISVNVCVFLHKLCSSFIQKQTSFTFFFCLCFLTSAVLIFSIVMQHNAKETSLYVKTFFAINLNLIRLNELDQTLIDHHHLRFKT